MDSVYLYNKYGTPISYDLWLALCELINWICDNWQRQDSGIWEVGWLRPSPALEKWMKPD